MPRSRQTTLDLPKECDYIVSKALAGEDTIASGGEDSSELPWLLAGAIEREVTRYNRKAGTNYHL